MSGRGSSRGLVGKVRRRLGLIARRLRERMYERRLGVQTSGYIYLEELGVSGGERIWHDPSEPVSLRRYLEKHATPDDVFADLGSGLGRAVLVAAEFPLKRVIGVEIAEDMNAVARRNLEATRSRLRCPSVELTTADVLEYDIPADLSLVYLYSPVVGETFDAMVDRLIESVDRHPRALRIAYNYPFEHNRLIRRDRMEVIDVDPGTWPSRGSAVPEVIVTYLIRPRANLPEVQRLLDGVRENLRGAEQWRGPYDPGLVLEREGEQRRPEALAPRDPES